MLKKIFLITYSIISRTRQSFSMMVWRLLLKKCGKDVVLLSGVKVIEPHNVEIGDHTWIGHNSFIMAGAKVSIGPWCQIASNTIITTTNHLISGELYYGQVEVKDITIGANVWIGSNAIILPGVSIGDNSIVGAGAVVSRDVPKNKIYAGVPAKEIKDLSTIFNK